MALADEKLQDLLSAYFKVCKQYGANSRLKRIDIFAKAVASPANRFYVSDEECFRIISHRLKGEPDKITSPTKQAMYNEIFSRYLSLQALFPYEKTKTLIEQIIRQPAPCFYMSPQYANVQINKYFADRKIQRFAYVGKEIKELKQSLNIK